MQRSRTMATARENRVVDFFQSERATSVHDIFSRISISQSRIFNCTKHAENSLKVMETCFHNEQLTDVILVAGNRRIPAHRLVLSAASEYFTAMFTSSLKESEQNVIELKEVDAEALLILVKYCYTGCIELQEKNLEMLFGTACLLQLNPVVEACCEFLLSELDPGNCLGIRMLADAQGCANLSNIAHAYVLKHFVEVIKNEEFLSLSAEEVTKLLESEDVNVPSEETIFHALTIWLQHDTKNRAENAYKLLSYVRLPLLSPTFIADHIENNELFKSPNSAQNLIMEAYKYHLLPEFRLLFQSDRTRPRKSTTDVLLAIGIKSIDAFSLKDNAWTNLLSISDTRPFCGAAIMEKKLLIVGGYAPVKTTNSVKSLDFSNLSWDTLPPMNTHRSFLGVAVLEGSLYAVGGFDGSSVLDTVERWDPVAHRWNYVAPMKCRRTGLGVAVLNNKLYAIGGWDNTTGLRTMESYDPHTNRWDYCAAMSQRRRKISTSVSVLNEYIYVVGGYDNSNYLDSVERYDTKSGTWSKVAPISVARSNIGVSTLGNQIFAIGGSNGSEDLTLVEVYDPVLNLWQEVSPLKVGRAGPCVVVNNLFLQS